MATETEKILNTISGLQNGDVICIQVAGGDMYDGWEDRFQVCGVSAHYILAFHDDVYTIINKLPTEYTYNGIPKESCVCGPDNLIFGYYKGYHFTDPAWVKEYMECLETGELEPSLRRRAWITKLELAEDKENGN